MFIARSVSRRFFFFLAPAGPVGRRPRSPQRWLRGDSSCSELQTTTPTGRSGSRSANLPAALYCPDSGPGRLCPATAECSLSAATATAAATVAAAADPSASTGRQGLSR